MSDENLDDNLEGLVFENPVSSTVNIESITINIQQSDENVIKKQAKASAPPEDEKKSQDVIQLTSSIKIFLNQKLHKTKLIYKGEKITAGEPIPVAVKLINYSCTKLQETLQEKNTKLLHAIDSHPNVVRIYDSGILDTEIKYIFIAMELCSPKTLYDYINENHPFNPKIAVRYSTQIISGLKYIHSRGRAHGDLKPHNILFSCPGYSQLKIAYFSDTKLAFGLGTPGYMAPELILEEKLKISLKSDVFSLGILLVFVLSNGKHPYGEYYYDWTPNIARGGDPNLTHILIPNGHQRNSMLRIISSMLQCDPGNRPSTADVLDRWLEEVDDHYEEPTRMPESQKYARNDTSGVSTKVQANYTRSNKGHYVTELSRSIKFFNNKNLCEGKLIYEGVKATELGPISLVVKLVPLSEEALWRAEFLPSIDTHPNVVKIYDCDRYYSDVAQYVFIAMERCSKETLFDYISQSTHFDTQLAMQHSIQIISGLEHLHSKGVTHGDIKPQNVLFDADDGYKQTKISDFGMLEINLDDPNLDFGTVGYAAPEIVTGKKHND